MKRHLLSALFVFFFVSSSYAAEAPRGDSGFPADMAEYVAQAHRDYRAQQAQLTFAEQIAQGADQTISDFPYSGTPLAGDKIWIQRGTGPGSDYHTLISDLPAGGGSGGGIANTLTCVNGPADATTFRNAVNTGGYYFIPPHSKCDISAVQNHDWSSETVFYSIQGARETIEIELGTGNKFIARAGASMEFYNLRFKSDSETARLVFADARLTGTVNRAFFIGNKWDSLNAVGIRWSNDNTAPGPKIKNYRFQYNRVFQPDSGEGLFNYGGSYENVWVTDNYMTGGKRGIRVGYVRTGQDPTWLADAQRIIISRNIVTGIDGNNTSSGVTVACLQAFAIQVIITNNICEGITDVEDMANTECAYTKAQFIIIANNSFRNCGHEQGMIAAKGVNGTAAPDVCEDGGDGTACARNSIIMGNMLWVDPATHPGNGKLCGIWVQSHNANITGNTIHGADNAAFCLGNSASYHNITLTDNHVYKHRSNRVVSLQGTNKYISIRGNHVYTPETSGSLDFVQAESTANVDRLNLNLNEFWAPNHDAKFLNIVSGGNITNLNAIGNDMGDTEICVAATGGLTNANFVGNFMQQCGIEFQGSASNCEATGNIGWNGSC